mgnify:CR=1 FL=1
MRSRRDFLKLSALLGLVGLSKTTPAFATTQKQDEFR